VLISRSSPLTPSTAAVLRAWLRERGNHPGEPLSPTRTGRRLSDDADDAAWLARLDGQAAP
jgi:integrase